MFYKKSGFTDLLLFISHFRGNNVQGFLIIYFCVISVLYLVLRFLFMICHDSFYDIRIK